MTTNLKSIAGTDFDDLFEAGTGNQLLSIYAMDGQDVGQKYLNVSQGSQVSANTGFQASDSADVRSKLCGKGTTWLSSYPCTSGVDELEVYVKQGQVLTLSYLGRTVSISDFLWRTTSHQGTI